MVPGKQEDQNSHQGGLGGQLGVMCVIQIVDSIMRSTPLVVDSCDNVRALKRYSIHTESVTLRWKQADIISCMSDVHHSIDSAMSLVHVYGHHNSQLSASILMPLASLNVRLGALAQYIMA